jgi:hypothetical protein
MPLSDPVVACAPLRASSLFKEYAIDNLAASLLAPNVFKECSVDGMRLSQAVNCGTNEAAIQQAKVKPFDGPSDVSTSFWVIAVLICCLSLARPLALVPGNEANKQNKCVSQTNRHRVQRGYGVCWPEQCC